MRRSPPTSAARAVRWIRRFYLSMIVMVIGGMLLHNLIIWRSKIIARRKLQQGFVTRMPLRFRWQHAALAHQFLHPCTHWIRIEVSRARGTTRCWGMSEHLRHLLHRIAAIVLIGVSLYHPLRHCLHPRRTQARP